MSRLEDRPGPVDGENAAPDGGRRAGPADGAGAGGEPEPWQLRIFRKSLKKRQKVELLVRMMDGPGGEPGSDSRCLLLTGGDNNGAMNHWFRTRGGRWTWAEMEETNIPAMERFLGEKVHRADAGELPFPDEAFDRVVVIDVHEHLDSVEPLNEEIARVLAPGGRAVVTTPNGDPRLPLARVKRWVGMDPAAYGHVVQGYTAEELEGMLTRAGLSPVSRGAYSRFCTELVELLINFAYVKLLSREGDAEDGGIAPGSEEALREVGASFRIYSALHPFLRAFSSLDRWLPRDGGYAVAVEARKDAGAR